MDIQKELASYEKYRNSKINAFGLQIGDFKNIDEYLGFLTWLNAKAQPKPEYPINYCDTDGGQGVYTHCLVCGADKNTLPFGASHE